MSSPAAGPPVAPPVSAPPGHHPVSAPPSHLPVSAPPHQRPVSAPSGQLSRAVADPAAFRPPVLRTDRSGGGSEVPTPPAVHQPARHVPPAPEPPTPTRPASDGPQGWFGPATDPPAKATPPASAPPMSAPPMSAPSDLVPPAHTPTDEPDLDPPASAVPMSAPPTSAVPMSAPPASAVPMSAPPAHLPPAEPSSDDRALVGNGTGPGDTDDRPDHAVSGGLGDGESADEGIGPDPSVAGSTDSDVPADNGQGPEDTDDGEPAPEPPADPEQVLAHFRWRLDPVTLREVVDDPEELREIRERLTDKLASALDNRSRARLLSLRAVASRVLDDLDDALADGRMALTYAEATGELRRTALAQARLAHLLRWRGEFAEADRLFAEANSIELPDRLRAALHEHSARCCYDQGRLIEACHHFERALDLRGEQDAELLDRVRIGLDAVAARAEQSGFGPYPRSWDEVLERDRAPVPARDGGQDLWGYADAEGEMLVPARYAEAQPFRDGLAWVREPQTDRWSLINLAGETVLEPAYLAARPFSDGLAWVVRDDSGWHAVDATGAVAVPPGFADVRPFHKGVAVVRREGWGAVDRTGRIVVPTRYHGFHTTLSDGHQVDGFTEEGLAVVDLAGRKGVVDRSGQVVVAPAHPALLIHPVAFLATNSAGNWGALDRRGGSLIDPMFHHPDAVVAEIDGLLADANPVL
ncbi:hypothetical protein HCA58_03180 [Micromonospora sp. HNM0581]|nr:hypothetical protein [Micromonospora sp. HNM0581]